MQTYEIFVLYAVIHGVCVCVCVCVWMSHFMNAPLHKCNEPIIPWIYPQPRMPVANKGLGWDSRS